MAFNSSTSKRYAEVMGYPGIDYIGKEPPTYYAKELISAIKMEMENGRPFEGAKEQTLSMLKDFEERRNNGQVDDYWKNVSNAKEIAFFQGLEASDYKRRESHRYIYEVSIPNDTGDNYIDEGKKLSGGAIQKVANALRNLPDSDWSTKGWHFAKSKEQMIAAVEAGRFKGKSLYSDLSNGLGSPRKASEFLSKAGIVGIKYDGQIDKQCAVIFNDGDIQIESKLRFSKDLNRPERQENEDDVEYVSRIVGHIRKNYPSVAKSYSIFKGTEETDAGDYDEETDNIRIFAYPRMTYADYEDTHFHENLHAFFKHEGILEDTDGVLGLIDVARKFDPEGIAKEEESIKKSGKYDGDENRELFIRLATDMMQSGHAKEALESLPTTTKEILENYFNTIEYEPAEEGYRATVQGNGSEGKGEDNSSREESEAMLRRSAKFEDTLREEVSDQNLKFSKRTKPAPEKTGIGYKVFYRGKDGKLYPPMVANPNGEDTPRGVWLDADAAPIAGTSKTGRPKVKAGGKGTQGGSGTLAYRPGWHLGEIPYAIQFNRLNPETGLKEFFPKDFVWAEVEYAADVDYQSEADAEGTNQNGKYQHSLAGLKKVPEDGFYRYRTNPNPVVNGFHFSYL